MNQERQRDIPLEQLRPFVQVYAIASHNSVQYTLMGHGYLTLLTDQFIEGNAYYIEVVKKSNDILLRSRLKRHNNYEKQKDTVIVWRDDELRNHQQLALSFQEEYEADFFWRLICEKIGQNYLNINPKDILEMPNENNLHQILDKTKNSKGMVQYHLLNSKQFLQSLYRVFTILITKKDKYNLGLIHKILKSILKNIDYRLVESLFGDITFEMILELQKITRKINYPQIWKQYIKIKNIFTLPQKAATKITIIHKIQFYRQHFLDVILDPYLNYIIILTQTESSKAIINILVDEQILSQIVQFKVTPQVLNQNNKKDNCIDEETCQTELEEINRKMLFQHKISFFMEAILMAKITNDPILKQKLLDKIYQQPTMSMFINFLDRNIVKTIYFFICLAQANPSRLFSFLKQNYQISSINNEQSLIEKLAKKYCTCLEDFQNSILDILNYFVENMKVEQNVSFMNKAFYQYVLNNFKDGKSLITILSEIMNNADSIQCILEQTVKNNIFTEIIIFINQTNKDKLQDIKILKIFKRIIKQNLKQNFLNQQLLKKINICIIESGFFQYCIFLLIKNIKKNNIFSSLMLGNFKHLKSKIFIVYHSFLQENKQKYKLIQKLIEETILQSQKSNIMMVQEKEQIAMIKQVQKEDILIIKDEEIALEKVESEDQLQGIERIRKIIKQNDES